MISMYLRLVPCFLGLLLLNSGSSQDNKTPQHTIDDLGWLAGSWTGSGGNAETEEHWLMPKGGMMLATNRTVNGDKGFFEFLRIQQKGDSLSYFASPAGHPAVEFRLKELAANRVVFENLANPFPQRIIYQRKDDEMHVKIEGEAEGKIRETSWQWKLSK